MQTRERANFVAGLLLGAIGAGGLVLLGALVATLGSLAK